MSSNNGCGMGTMAGAIAFILMISLMVGSCSGPSSYSSSDASYSSSSYSSSSSSSSYSPSSSSSSSSSKSKDSVECPICGGSTTESQLAWQGMCKSCYKTYESLKDAE